MTEQSSPNAPAGRERPHGTKRLLRQTAMSLLDALVRLQRALPGRNTTKKPARVLLAAANGLMANNVLRTWECVVGHIHADASITRFPGHEAWRERADLSNVRWIRPGRARFHDWDLILQADHMSLEFPASIPKVLIGHGVGWTRLVKGGIYRYDRDRALLPDGRPTYALMLDAAEITASAGRRALPECADRIRIVGNLDADDLLRLRSHSDEVRLRLGVGNRKLVVVMSSWGPHGLIPKYGVDLLPVLEQLTATGDYAFVLTMHHNLWASHSPIDWASRVTSAAQEHIYVVGSGEDAGPYLAASDAAISDHTSYSAKYAVLDRAIIPMHVPPDYLVPGSFARWLMEEHNPLSDPRDIPEALSAMASYLPSHAPRFVDRIGESERLTRTAILELLPAYVRQRAKEVRLKESG